MKSQLIRFAILTALIAAPVAASAHPTTVRTRPAQTGHDHAPVGHIEKTPHR